MIRSADKGGTVVLLNTGLYISLNEYMLKHFSKYGIPRGDTIDCYTIQL